ncbi:sporulation protein YabP [uncultured Tyzzerella sp.]|uniref:sporulation protein YabP n=1 Tax=uncultured Tyzzerella sp. TaxID=2321398 RepID=UPI0029420A9B|nr:sporulation protein YabP [uncultured Tyzzerella sp.]
MSEEKRNKHNISILDRTNIKITGVIDVISFDEEIIVSETELGILILKGLNFHINKLNLDSGDLEITGEIYSLVYEDKSSYGKPGGSILSKIFK